MNSAVTIRQIISMDTFFFQEGLSFVGIFGSQARGEAKVDSDIDILIDYPSPKSFFELARIQIKLEERLNTKVDLVTRQSVKPALRENIEHDLIAVYGQE